MVVSGPNRKKVSVPRQPESGSVARRRIMGGIAPATIRHLRNDRNRFTRIPIRNTTNSPSTSAVNRPGRTGDIATSLGHIYV